MTLYRIDQDQMNEKSAMGLYKPAHDRAVEHFERLKEQKVLVPVTEELLSRAEWEATIDYEAAVTVLSNYRRLVLMGAEGGFVTTLNELFDAAVGEETP